MESSTPASLRWQDSPVTLYVASGTQAAIPVGELHQVVERARVEWRSACPDCTLPKILVRRLDEPHSSDPDALMYPHPVDREAALPLIPARSDVAELQALYPPRPFASNGLVATLAVVLGLGVLAAAVRCLSKQVRVE